MPKNQLSTQTTVPEKVAEFGSHNISALLRSQNMENSLFAWVGMYIEVHVKDSALNTQAAKQNDLKRFLQFFGERFGHDHVDSWTPSVTKAFMRYLQQTPQQRKADEKKENGRGEGKPLAATSIRRIMATLRHFAKWLHSQRPLLAGNPLAGVKDLAIEQPIWNGISDRDRMRLKSACEQRMAICKRENQNPLMEAAVFYCLLFTGLRRFELAVLNIGQYYTRGFHQVKRKGNKVTIKVPVPGEAREWLDRYLEERRTEAGGTLSDNAPLFVTRYGNRIDGKTIWRISKRIAAQASVNIREGESLLQLAPHKLRHTFLKAVADKYDVHVAQEMSGNISMKEIFSYTKPSQEEKDQLAENVF